MICKKKIYILIIILISGSYKVLFFFLNSCETIRTDPEQNVKTTTTKAKCEMNITLCLLHSITGSDLVLAVGVSKAHTTKHPRLHIHQAEHRISTISTEALHFLLVSQENRREVSQSHVIVQWKKQSIFSGLRKKKFIETASVFWTFFLGAGGYTRCTTYTGKGIGFEREHTHEETLIYFSLRARDVLLIDHQSGRLLPIHDQGKLMSTCRAKCCVCFVFVTAQTAWMYVHLRAVRVTLTVYQREGINEKMWWN